MGIGLIIINGLIASSLMVAFMGWVHSDRILAIRSLYSRTYEKTLFPGILVHYTIGIFFAFIYAGFVQLSPVSTPWAIITLTTFIGLVHGTLVGLFLETTLTQRTSKSAPPIKTVQFSIVIAHILGHVVYGFSIGVIFAMNRDRLNRIFQDWITVGDIKDGMAGLTIGLVWFILPISCIAAFYFFFIKSKPAQLPQVNHTPDHRRKAHRPIRYLKRPGRPKIKIQ